MVQFMFNVALASLYERLVLNGNATANIDAAYLELGLTVYNEEL